MDGIFDTFSRFQTTTAGVRTKPAWSPALGSFKLEAMQNPLFAQIVKEIEDFARTAANLGALEEYVVEQIAFRLTAYNWVGVYWLDPGDLQVLELGAFIGAPTSHTHIPVTQGICGAAIRQGETIVVNDVRADPRYLSCSIETKSEIVVPIRAHGRVVGEIDIDSHSAAAFGAEDRVFLELCAGLIGAFMESTTESPRPLL
jgi:GAF domain-containing protein